MMITTRHTTAIMLPAVATAAAPTAFASRSADLVTEVVVGQPMASKECISTGQLWSIVRDTPRIYTCVALEIQPCRYATMSLSTLPLSVIDVAYEQNIIAFRIVKPHEQYALTLLAT